MQFVGSAGTPSGQPRRPSRRAVRSLFAAVVGLAAAAAMVTPARAATPVSAPVSGPASVPEDLSNEPVLASPRVPDKDLPAAAKHAFEFWTPERMAAATPLEVRLPDPAVTAQRYARIKPGKPGRVDPIAPKSAPAGPAATADVPVAQPMVTRGARWTGGGIPSVAIGKAYFRQEDGKLYSCTAQSIRSDTGNAVLTAGHCVVNHENGNWFNWNYQTNTWGDWIFVPGYDNGSQPNGTWYANQLFSGPGYIDKKADFNSTYDIGAAVMNTNNGRHLADVVGAYGVQWNASRSRAIRTFGYPQDGNHDLPAAQRYNGSVLISCSGTTYDLSGNVGMSCDAGHGASGGAWVAEFSTNGGWITTVQSGSHFTDTAKTVIDWSVGAYFGDNMGNLWEAIRGK